MYSYTYPYPWGSSMTKELWFIHLLSPLAIKLSIDDEDDGDEDTDDDGDVYY
jgi:hypothetical protein